MVVSGVSHLTKLETLNVEDNQIVKLANLSTCTALAQLLAKRNRIRRVEEVDVRVRATLPPLPCRIVPCM